MSTLKKRPKGQDVEFEPDAWQRFERAVAVVAKSPPQHRTKKIVTPKAAKAQSKRRKSDG